MLKLFETTNSVRHYHFVCAETFFFKTYYGVNYQIRARFLNCTDVDLNKAHLH